MATICDDGETKLRKKDCPWCGYGTLLIYETPTGENDEGEEESRYLETCSYCNWIDRYIGEPWD